jgi:hemerythrin
MKWSENYATGLKHIDDQHKMLFTMGDDFRDALDVGRGKKVYRHLLDMLQNYADIHFRMEEGCMEQYRCPVAQTNKEAHVKFLAVLADFQQRYTDSGFDHVDARNLVDTLEQWLTDHICRIDVKLKQYVKP